MKFQSSSANADTSLVQKRRDPTKGPEDDEKDWGGKTDM